MTRILIATALLIAVFTVSAFADSDAVGVTLTIAGTVAVTAPADVSFGTLTAQNLSDMQVTSSAGNLVIHANAPYDLDVQVTDIASTSTPADVIKLFARKAAGVFQGTANNTAYDLDEQTAPGNLGDSTSWTYRAGDTTAGGGLSWTTPIHNDYVGSVNYTVSID